MAENVNIVLTLVMYTVIFNFHLNLLAKHSEMFEQSVQCPNRNAGGQVVSSGCLSFEYNLVSSGYFFHSSIMYNLVV